MEGRGAERVSTGEPEVVVLDAPPHYLTVKLVAASRV